ncbi:MAG TPA: VOC family protein [Thermomicrobiales bacterium]|nr:VOC family protein [Thermomicrobiales bacterium]
MIHHIELWVPDFARAVASWEWLLAELGCRRYQEFAGGVSWRLPATGTYIVLEQSPDMLAIGHDRHRPGLNHLAFDAGSREVVDRLTAESKGHGWSLLFADRHPFAGGPDHYAAYLEDQDGFEVELVAGDS